MIKVSNLSQDFKIYKKDPGFLGSVKSLWNRKYFLRHALKNINFTVQSNEMVGLIGANGAGKTTLIKILSGIIHPTSGHVRVLDFDPSKRTNAYRKNLSLIMGQKSQLWWDLPAYDSFLLLKEIYQIPNEMFQKNLKTMCELFQLKDQLHIQVRRLSLGERMKVELIAALLHSPKVIFLDEPTIGLDYSSQLAVRDFLRNYQQQFKPLIILTSHYMKDIEELCPRIILMKEGEIIFDDQLSVIKNKYTEKKLLRFCVAIHDVEKIKQKVQELLKLPALISDIKHNNTEVEMRVNQNEIGHILSLLVNDLRLEDISLNELDIGELISRELNA